MTTLTPCPAPDELLAYVAGPTGEHALAPERRELLEAHTADCGSCRQTLLALGLGTTPGTDEEEALLEQLLARQAPTPPLPGEEPSRAALPTPGAAAGPLFPTATSSHGPERDAVRPGPIAPWQRHRGQLLAALAAAGVATAAVLLFLPAGPDAEALLGGLTPAARPSEARSSLALPYAPFRPLRGPQASVSADPVLAELLRAKERDASSAARPLAMFYVLRGEPGDLARADAELAAAGPGARAQNDRGVVALAGGNLPGALAAFDRAVALDGTLPSALFNRGVVLARLGERSEAASAFRAYLAVAPAEPGWAAEARERLAELER